ncbi:MAG: alpha-amylase, partial [Polyangiaceae bacterium]|nr:alpha-amylase [Polyangiaceae bacterium]
ELVFRFLDNNDTGERFVTKHGRGLHRAASALLFTLPGIPSVFTGQEVAAQYEPYQREEPLSFEGSSETFSHFAQLARLRSASPALRQGVFIPLEVEPRDRAFAYLRVAEPGGDSVLVVINFGEAPLRARLNLDGPAGEILGPRPTDLLDAGPAPAFVGRTIEISLGAWGARVLASARPVAGTTPPHALAGAR